MLTVEEVRKTRVQAASYLGRAGIVLTAREKEEIEVADLGLGSLRETGVQIVTYVNTERCCAKEIVLFPRQTCPEHRHPPVTSESGTELEPGKEETFRCRWGRVYLYVPGTPAPRPACRPPKGRERYHTVWHEVVLEPGDQYTLYPDTLHWFQAGDEGAVISEFSTRSRDELDVFTDPDVKRMPEIAD